MTRAEFWVTFGFFAGLETIFGLLFCNDACLQFVKTYPGFTLALTATLLALVLTLACVSVHLTRRLRRKPVPAIEVIHAEPGRFLP